MRSMWHRSYKRSSDETSHASRGERVEAANNVTSLDDGLSAIVAPIQNFQYRDHWVLLWNKYNGDYWSTGVVRSFRAWASQAVLRRIRINRVVEFGRVSTQKSGKWSVGGGSSACSVKFSGNFRIADPNTFNRR